ncbi:LPXTG cell wall anchor domain-containing protein [Arthrobacter sp. USHLN218]|uniref:LPXTG cell wall anchor domain-containing protein n=1 Tax=Arthrobacter sp. USHLN218 TaxID=3081232 RepID=UPI003017AF66
MKKTLTALAIAGSLTFLGAGAAQAADANYPAAPVVVTVDDSVVNIGQVFIFAGSGFDPNEPINIAVTLIDEPNAAGAASGLGAGGGLAAAVGGFIAPATVVDGFGVQADEDGNFSTEISLDAPGTYRITAEGQESGLTRSITVDVVAASAAGGPDADGIDGGAGGTGNTGDEDAVANGDSLANTGLESSALLWGGAGVLALGAGAAAVVVSRRKNA